jgi:hypothetical protein
MAEEPTAESDKMTGYFLVRESVALARAVLAAIKREDLPELVGWLTGSAEMEYCLLDDQEFERAKTDRDAIVLTSCDLVADKMTDPRSRRAAEVVLCHLDGTASEEELEAASRETRQVVMSIMQRRVPGTNFPDQGSPEYCAAALAYMATGSRIDLRTGPDVTEGWLDSCAGGTVSDFLIWYTMGAAKDDPFIAARVTGLLRDICGNPVRAVVAQPAWRSPDLKLLARAIYDLKAFDRLAELADALEALGCDEPSVLEHCRSPGPHVQGCWVLELLLGYGS